MIVIQITERGKERQWWKELLALYLKSGEKFEIHCWKNEKKTPFFSLQTDGISSEHYGTEIYLEEKPEDEIALNRLMETIAPYANISEAVNE